MPEIFKAILLVLVGIPVGVGLGMALEYSVRRKTAKLVAAYEKDSPSDRT